ncbi:MAG: RnfABCDGE type electron transport complex subunit D [Rubricella sp.]
MLTLWRRDTIGWLILAALLPAIGLAVLGGNGLAFTGALVIASLWQALFRHEAGIPLSPSGVVTAASVAILASPDLGLVQIALAVTIGMVLGELVFGGWGRNVIAAPVVTLATLTLAFPGLAPAPADPWLLPAAGAGALMLLTTGILSLGAMAAAAIAFACVILLAGAGWPEGGALGHLAFVAVFLLGDPVTGGQTRAGRILHGALGGALAALLTLSAPDVAGPAVFAVLLASVFAPLIDHGVVAYHIQRRNRRHG